jgi:hypothetical protein
VARWFPDGRSILVCGSEAGGPLMLHRIDLETGLRTPVGPREAVNIHFELSPDGRFIAAQTAKAPRMLYPVDGGDPLPIPGLRADDTIHPWKLENEAILVSGEGEVPVRIQRLELATGARTPWREISPPDPSGVWSATRFHFQPDGQTYGYTYHLQLDDLYLVENLR